MSTKLYDELKYQKSVVAVLEDSYSYDEETDEIVEAHGLKDARKKLADIKSKIKELESV